MLCSPSTKSFCGAMYAPELVSMSKRGYSPIHLCCSAVVSNTVFLFVTNLLSFSTLQLSDLAWCMILAHGLLRYRSVGLSPFEAIDQTKHWRQAPSFLGSVDQRALSDESECLSFLFLAVPVFLLPALSSSFKDYGRIKGE